MSKSNGLYEVFDLVTDARRGEVIKTKIEKYFPEASKFPGSGYILKLLPSYGGDWEQYHEIRMEWKEQDNIIPCDRYWNGSFAGV